MYALFSMFAASTTRERVASEGGHFLLGSVLPLSLHLLAHTLSPGFTQGQLVGFPDASNEHPCNWVDSPLNPLMLMNGSITVTRVLDSAVNGMVDMV
jgi:hypothetical protein